MTKDQESGEVKKTASSYSTTAIPKDRTETTTLPIPTNEESVAWAEEALELEAVAVAARNLIWESENWESYEDSKKSNSVAWPPEFLLLAEAVVRKCGPPDAESVKSCPTCGHSNMGSDGLCKESVPLIDKEPHGAKLCGHPCVNYGLRGAWWQGSTKERFGEQKSK
jgi:hypothetical protein